MVSLLKVASIALASAAVIALSGCGEIKTISPLGQGECGTDPVTLSTSQDVAGDQLSIHYSGPANVSLVLNYGFYTDVSINGSSAPATVEFSDGGTNTVDAYLIRLSANNPGWSSAGSGSEVSYDFAGSIQDLLNGVQTQWDLTIPASAAQINSLFPVVIGVSCDSTIATGLLSGATADGQVAGIEYAVAQPLLPNHMLFNPYDIVSTADTAQGTDITFKFQADAYNTFGQFVPSVPQQLSVIVDDLNVSNMTVSDLWFQFFSANEASVVTGTPVVNQDGTFTVSFSQNNGPLAPGNYLIFSPVQNQAQTAFKLVFSELNYSANSGVTISDPFVAKVATEELPAPELASTGTNFAIASIGALIAGIAGSAILFIRRRQVK